MYKHKATSEFLTCLFLIISTRLCGTLSPSTTAPLPPVLFANGNRSERAVKWLVLCGAKPSIIMPPVSLVIFVTLKYSLSSEDIQRRVSQWCAKNGFAVHCFVGLTNLRLQFVLSMILMVRRNTAVCFWLCLLIVLCFRIFVWKTLLSVFLEYVLFYLLLNCGINNMKWTFFYKLMT